MLFASSIYRRERCGESYGWCFVF